MKMPDYTAIWPDIFEDLTEDQQDVLMNILGSHWIDGYQPTKNKIIEFVQLMKNGADKHEQISVLSTVE